MAAAGPKKKYSHPNLNSRSIARLVLFAQMGIELHIPLFVIKVGLTVIFFFVRNVAHPTQDTRVARNSGQ